MDEKKKKIPLHSGLKVKKKQEKKNRGVSIFSFFFLSPTPSSVGTKPYMEDMEFAHRGVSLKMMMIASLLA